MILKDFYCIDCHSTVVDVEVASASVCALTLECDECAALSPHVAQCNGGRGSRYRFRDWNTREVAKGIEYVGGGACYGDETTGKPNKDNPVVDMTTGRRIQDDQKYSADARAEKRARVWHRRDQRDGRGKIINTKRATSGREERA